MEIDARAKKIKLLLLDVDGVLSDGKIIIGSYGDELKNFNVNDGLGIILAKKVGIKCVIITARNSKIVKIRAKQIGIDRIYENHYKIESLNDILRRFNVQAEEICFMGDELIDMPILKRVGLAVAVPNAVEEVKEIVHYVTKKEGGQGAVREVCEIILKSQDKWEGAIKRYLE